MLNADIDIVRSNIALTELHAPFDGVIGLRNVSEGAYASPSVVVAKLTKIKPLKIDLSVPERYASQIKPGTRLTFTVEGTTRRFTPRYTPPNRRSTPIPTTSRYVRTTPTRGAGCYPDAS